MSNIQIYIPDVVQDIIQKLNNANYEAYVCGGAVRDSLMNKIPKEDSDLNKDLNKKEGGNAFFFIGY